MRLDCVHNTLTIVEYAIVATIGRELTLHYDLRKLLHLKSDSET